jgi:hypothetical protein
MKTLALILVIPCVYAQSPAKPPKERKVTVTGCVYQGVECFTLKDSKGKQDYSIAKSDKFKVGQGYKITGTIAEIGFCQEGKPMLAVEKISDAKLKCDVAASSKQKK